MTILLISISNCSLFYNLNCSRAYMPLFLFYKKWQPQLLIWFLDYIIGNSNITSFFRFVDKRAIYRWYNLIHTCAGECDWFFHWQHKLCAICSANVNINYRLPIKVYYRICILRHISIEINHGSQNVFWVLTWVGGY
jgi:hypothetical protein